MARRFELWEYAHDGNGIPVSGATLEFFVGGSSFGIEKDVYSDESLTTPIQQPIESDASGRWPDIWMASALYDVRQVCGSTTITRANYDPGLAVGLGVSSAVPVEFGGTGANNPAAARTNLLAASSAALTTAQDSITVLETQVATGLNDSNEFGALASEDTVTRDLLATSYGNVEVQSVDATPYTANENLATGIPLDDSTPTISEGDEILTANITPTSSSNKIEIEIAGFGSAGSYLIWAVFRGTTCIFVGVGVNNNFSSIATSYVDTPNTGSQVTYSVRVGSPSSTARMNGTTSARLFGGTAKCTMRLREIETH